MDRLRDECPECQGGLTFRGYFHAMGPFKYQCNNTNCSKTVLHDDELREQSNAATEEAGETTP